MTNIMKNLDLDDMSDDIYKNIFEKMAEYV